MATQFPLMEGLLLVHKPAGIDSGSIINILKRELKVKKIGHTGTLDPLASGLLVICVGRNFTRLAETIQKLPKRYYVEIELGRTSGTYDRTGFIFSETFAHDFAFQPENLIPTGKVLQKVPYYSALKQDGKTLREHAEKGNFVEKFNEIEIYDWESVACIPEKRFLAFNITVSKGTYIRTIVENIGIKTGYGAVMKSLVRLSVGDFRLERAYSPEHIVRIAKEGRAETLLLADVGFFAQENR